MPGDTRLRLGSAERRARDKARRRTIQYVERNAVDSGLPHIALAKWGRCAPVAVGWWELRASCNALQLA